MRLLTTTVGLLAVCAGLCGQDAEAIRSAMQASIEKQKESVRHQTGAPAAAAGAANTSAGAAAKTSFFTVEWPQPPSFAALLAAPPADCDPLPNSQVDELVASAAKQQGLKPELIRAVMEQESGFKPCVESARGALGLMQLMPSTADDFHVDDVFDPAQNVSAGAKLLKALLDKYGGDIRLALSAYNAGIERVDQNGGIPDIPETKDYVSSILSRLSAEAAAPRPVSPVPPAAAVPSATTVPPATTQATAKPAAATGP